MEKLKFCAMALPILVASSPCFSLPGAGDTYSDLDKIPEWQILGGEEMESTSGEILPLGFAGIAAIVGTAIGTAGSNAINQYEASGTVGLGEVALAGLMGGAVAAVNVAAAITGSPVVIVTAVGLDIAVTVASAVGADFVGPPTPTPVVDLSKINMPPTFGIVYGPPVYQPPVIAVSPGPDFGGGAGEEHYLYF